MVADKNAQPRSERETVHHESMDNEHLAVIVFIITPGYEDFALLLPKLSVDINVLIDARGGCVVVIGLGEVFSDKVN